MTLRVEPDRIVADLKADSIIWIEEVAQLPPMPARDWPPETIAKVERYTNAHFLLSAGGAPLQGKIVEARYRQFPWEVNEEGAFFIRLIYPPAPVGATLTATTRFYEEYRKELERELAPPIPFVDGYRTILEIPGRRRRTFTLSPATPTAAVSAAEARRTGLAMTLEASAAGAQAALGMAAGFPALLAIALCLGAAPPGRAALSILLASAAGGFITGLFFTPPPWLIWAATFVASLVVGRPRTALALSAAAAGSLACAWCAAASPLLPHYALAFPSALIGALAAGTALLLAAGFGVRAEHRRLACVCESRVAELFARRARLTATALAMVGAYGFWQSFQR